MAGHIEDYAVIGDTNTVALVDRSGSIDWWCVPRIDSDACFAALLGHPGNGRWLIAPNDEVISVTRRYEPETLVLETVFETATGTVAVTDFMPPTNPHPTIHRVVQGRGGTVSMNMELIVRFDYGSVTPWVRSTGDGLTLMAGANALRFHSPVRLEGHDDTTVASFEVGPTNRLSFSLSWYPSATESPLPLDSLAALVRTRRWWRDWASRCTYQGEWRDEVIRSLITLKALTYGPTGAVCAAATTSLPESIGGVRNWDYRYSWLRDATLTLQALLTTGYVEEATQWSRWLRRAVAGDPGEFQIMYGVGGERRLTELEIDWLDGYEGSRPVRIGNAASDQFQLDVFGEIMDAAYTATRNDLRGEQGYGGEIIVALMEHLENVWDQPDDGIWEVRGPQRHFTHSKVMAWVAFDRAVRLAEADGRHGSRVSRWRELRDTVHAEVCDKGFNTSVGAFTQYYGSDLLDASLLMIPMVGFLAPDDPRVISTVEAIQERLMVDGFLKRYETATETVHHTATTATGTADAGAGTGDAAAPTVDTGAGTEPANPVDGLPGDEGAFLMTTFWLSDALSLMGRHDEALEIFDRLRGLCNDVGLLSEEYDPKAGRMLGNFPQAFSHVGLINTAVNLSMAEEDRAQVRAARPAHPVPPSS